MRKSTQIHPLSEETRQKDACEWLTILKFHESGTVIQIQSDCEFYIPPTLTNRIYRRQFLGKNHENFLLGYVRIDQKNILTEIRTKLIELTKAHPHLSKLHTSGMSIELILNACNENGVSVGIFLSHISPILMSQNFQQLYDLEHILRLYPNFSVLVFSEIDITTDSYTNLIDQCSSLFTHIFTYPLYGERDVDQFIRYNECQWHISIPDDIKFSIKKETGGHLWLLRQALRYWRDHRNTTIPELFTHDLMQMKVRAFWQKFSPQEQEILKKITMKSLNENDRLSHAYHYLSRIKVIDDESGKPSIQVPILNQIILNQTYVNELRLFDGHIQLKGIDIHNEFTVSESSFLTSLLEQKGTIVTKEQIAERIWGASWQDRYSDWALDRLIYRVRNKIRRLGIKPMTIKSIKKKGVIYTENL